MNRSGFQVGRYRNKTAGSPNFLSPTMYNDHVALWRRAAIHYGYRLNKSLGWKLLWKLAPYQCVG